MQHSEIIRYPEHSVMLTVEFATAFGPQFFGNWGVTVKTRKKNKLKWSIVYSFDPYIVKPSVPNYEFDIFYREAILKHVSEEVILKTMENLWNRFKPTKF